MPPPEGNVVGPGISRCEYGGFMMSYPPRRMYGCLVGSRLSRVSYKGGSSADGAIDYATKPLVVYVAARPPVTAIRSFAKRFGKKIVYIPLGSFHLLP